MNLSSVFKNKKPEQLTVDFEKLPNKSRTKLGLSPLLRYTKKCGYSIVKIDYNTGLVRFTKDYTSINLYTTTGTISTEINHPKSGKTQLHRKGLNMSELKEVFNNPRIHTGKRML